MLRAMAWPDTYSQYDEQHAILGYFDAVPLGHKGRGEGRFLDIGAWDPICFSNTRALFERGWSGVMIEPSPTPLLSLLKAYGDEPRIKIIEAAVGLEDSLVSFQVSDDSVSTLDPESFAKWKDQAAFRGSVSVRTITWPQINTWWDGFDFVNIDAEGISVDLFHSMLGSGVKPVCVCVEHDGRLAELAGVATAPNVRYKMLYSNGTNAVFAL